MAIAAILNSLGSLTCRDRKSILRAVLLIMDDCLLLYEDILLARCRLQELVQEDCETDDDGTLVSESSSSSGNGDCSITTLV